MENWKQQLTDASRDEEEDDDDDDPQVLKAKQEHAWRSVGALQLRVEELTLEVTKVQYICKCVYIYQNWRDVHFVFSY